MRFKCVCCYNGSKYNGWQIQAGNPTSTIQGVVVEALADVTGCVLSIHGAGRTDTGGACPWTSISC